MVKVGMYPMAGDGMSDEECLRMIKAAGFDFVCLGMRKIADRSLGDALKICEKLDLPVDNIHLIGTGTTEIWSEGRYGDEVAERYCRQIEYCASFGVRVGITHVTWGHQPPRPVSEIGLSRFARIAECAEKNQFTLALENSVFPGHLYGAMDRLSDLPNIGFCFDSGHQNAFAPEEDFLGRLGSRLAATHLQDNNGKLDLHVMPLDGCAPWEKIAKKLAATKLGSSRITAEVSGDPLKKMPGFSREEIARAIAPMAAAHEEKIVRIYDGAVTFYENFSYAQKVDRLYDAMTRVAAMIEKAAAAGDSRNRS